MIRPKEYNVVVTACAPFKENESNPTQAVKTSLPNRVERQGRTPIKIIKFHTDFRNVMSDMDIIPTMWSGNRQVYEPGCPEEQKIRVDAMLHLGMNFQSTWAVEKRARRDGYDWVGDDGVPLPKHNGGKGQRWEGLPDVLKPAFDVDKIVGGLQAVLPGTPTVISTDAGLMYCEFIFYSSLATLYRRNEMPRALFLHHAGKMSSPAGIAEGARVATSAICLMVDQIEAGDLLGTGV